MTSSEINLTLLETVPDLKYIKERESYWINLNGELNEFDSIVNLEKIANRVEKRKITGKIVTDCECGGKWTHDHSKRHKKTDKHRNFLKNKILGNSINAPKEINKEIFVIPKGNSQ